MPVSGRELSTLDFANLIGGPLNAVIEAQAKSAITTANFIKEVGLDDNNQIVNMTFKYNKVNEEGNEDKFTLTVPFLTMLPVPYITVDKVIIKFNAKVTSTNTSKVNDNFSQNVNTDVRAGWWFSSARMNTQTSYQRQTSATEKAERTFDMKIEVEAGNLQMPEGTERLLSILEEAVTEKKQKLNTMAVRLISLTEDSANLGTFNGAEIEASNPDVLTSTAAKTFNDRTGKPIKITYDTASKKATLDPGVDAKMEGRTVEITL